MLLLDISTGDCKQPLKLEEGEFLSRPETVYQPTHSPHHYLLSAAAKWKMQGMINTGYTMVNPHKRPFSL